MVGEWCCDFGELVLDDSQLWLRPCPGEIAMLLNSRLERDCRSDTLGRSLWGLKSSTGVVEVGVSGSATKVSARLVRVFRLRVGWSIGDVDGVVMPISRSCILAILTSMLPIKAL